MSTNTLEKALWQIGTNPDEADKFLEDPDLYSTGFRLEDDERQSLAALDVGSMARRDVNTLLLMMAHMAVLGPDAMPRYMESMNRTNG